VVTALDAAHTLGFQRLSIAAQSLQPEPELDDGQ